ncbi:MAG: hypothetical protein H6581_29745 [Bacteroidia bacterium]|nr:hypothetical protein [Bacteroidia bacterium]
MNIMFEGYIDATTRNNILKSLKLLNAQLPFLMQLSNAERKKIASIGMSRTPFVKRVKTLSNQRDEFLPNFAPLATVNRRYEMMEFFDELLTLMRTLLESIDDTDLILGAYLYKIGRAYHSIARKSVEMGIPGADTIVKDLDRFFDRYGRPIDPDALPAEDPLDDAPAEDA